MVNCVEHQHEAAEKQQRGGTFAADLRVMVERVNNIEYRGEDKRLTVVVLVRKYKGNRYKRRVGRENLEQYKAVEVRQRILHRTYYHCENIVYSSAVVKVVPANLNRGVVIVAVDI